MSQPPLPTPEPLRPRALHPGDRVHLISPAGPVIPEILEEGIRFFRHLGLDLVIDETIYARRPPYDYLAGDDSLRLEAFKRAWADPEARALICTRGGYGTMRLLPLLEPEFLRAHPKLLLGFSDITALHLYFSARVGIATLHGPVIKSIGLHGADPHQTLDALQEALFASTATPRPWEGLKTLRPGTVTGPVYGGNLSLLIPLLATPYCPDLEGAILIL